MSTPITIQQLNRDTPAGSNVSMAAADVTGNTYPNGSTCSLRVKNAGTSPVTMTVAIPGTIDGVAKTDKAFTIPADNAIYEFAPFPRSIYGETVTITWSAVTSVTVAVTAFDPED